MAVRWRSIRSWLGAAVDTTLNSFGVHVESQPVTLLSGRCQTVGVTIATTDTDETVNLPDGTRSIRMTATTVTATIAVAYALDESTEKVLVNGTFTDGGFLLVSIPVERVVSKTGTSSGVLHLQGAQNDVILIECF